MQSFLLIVGGREPCRFFLVLTRRGLLSQTDPRTSRIPFPFRRVPYYFFTLLRKRAVEKAALGTIQLSTQHLGRFKAQ